MMNSTASQNPASRHTYKRLPGALLLSLLSFSGCANIDRSMMSVSDAISSRDPVTGAREINLMSEQAEIQQGTRAAQELLQQASRKNIPIDHQVPGFGRVVNIMNRLRPVVHRQNLPWEVHLVGQDTWNAFTVGGGKIFLFNGLTKGPAAIQNDDEMAVVLAHEMAHNTARHIGERQGKSLITQLADKKTRSDLYQASFSTHQEYEADKFSVIYMALAGYDPMAAVNVWTRVARTRGSYSANMLHTHPLNADRARRLQGWAAQARQYYMSGRINPQAAQILQCNVIFCNRSTGQQAAAGSGAGAAALLETVANAYLETSQAKAEAKQREQLRNQQVQQAAKRLSFSNVRVIKNRSGQPRATGTAENRSAQAIQGGVVQVQYLQAGKVVHRHSIKWPAMQGRDRKPFTIPLKSGNFDSVRLIPTLVQ